MGKKHASQYANFGSLPKFLQNLLPVPADCVHTDGKLFGNGLAHHSLINQPEHLLLPLGQDTSCMAFFQSSDLSRHRMYHHTTFRKLRKQRVIQAQGKPQATVSGSGYIKHPMQCGLIIA